MTTERMTDERREDLRGYLDRQYVKAHEAAEINAELDRARRVEQEQAEKIRKLEDMLRLANDKMAEQVRQARWEVADEALRMPRDWRMVDGYLSRVAEENAPKD